MASSNQTISTFSYSSTQQYLFNRTYSLAIGAPNQTSALQYSNVEYVQNLGGLEVIQEPSPLRITFDIDKRITGTSNNSKIELYNLAFETKTLFRTGYILQLKAGYRGLMDTIFVGNINAKGTKSERKGSDIITSFECGEGESTIVMTRLDKSYGPGTTLVQVIQDIAVAMSVNSVVSDGGVGAGSVLGIPAFTYGRGIVLHGSTRDSLNKILKPFGLRWSIQNGNLNIIPVTAYNGKTAVIVSSGSTVDSNGVSYFDPNNSTGLIGIPSWNGLVLEFTSLLNPHIVPGGRIQLISENTTLNGFYKIVRAHYTGDTHESKWQVACEASKLDGRVQTLPSSNGFNFAPAVD